MTTARSNADRSAGRRSLLAVALGEDYRPADGIVEVVRESAGMIAALPGGAPGVFLPPLIVTNEDPWTDALRLLGRSPTGVR